MEQERLEALREAVKSRRKKETLEAAVGRIARKKGLDFSSYVNIMSEVRDRAHEEGVTVEKAAETILGEGGEDPE